MSLAALHDSSGPLTTDGEIAALNLESARRSAWIRFTQDPRAPSVAEALVDMERLSLQFLGDLNALDRLDMLASHFAVADDTFRAELIAAEAASTAHRFSEARAHLARAKVMGAPGEDIERQTLAIDQACGCALADVLAARRRRAAASGRLEELVPLGALLADLEYFDEAEAVYRQALQAYGDVSPFPPAWVCFQLGMLWGELVSERDLAVAAHWYRRAVAYLPAYTKARVHLAEIHASQDRSGNAETLLMPALSSCDPEVRWRLADVLDAQERFEEAAKHLQAARSGFEELVAKHLLAFADHAAEFYAGSGNDCERALELARANVANRPTRRAIEQLQTIAALADTAASAGALCNGTPTISYMAATSLSQHGSQLHHTELHGRIVTGGEA